MLPGSRAKGAPAEVSEGGRGPVFHGKKATDVSGSRSSSQKRSGCPSFQICLVPKNREGGKKGPEGGSLEGFPKRKRH